MTTTAKKRDRRRALRAAKREPHADRYADKPKGAERDLSEALAALADRYSPEWVHR